MRTIAIVISLFFLSHLAIGQKNNPIEPVLKSLTDFQYIRDFALSSSGLEGYITVQSALAEVSVLVQIKNVNNIWKEPKIMPFSGKYNDLEPFLAKNDLRLYFVSNRPINETDDQPKDFDIWYVERANVDSPWGDPVNIGAPVNTVHNEFYPSLAENNNLYFTSDNPISKGKDDIFYSMWTQNTYAEPISLSDSINTDGYEFNAYIATDETYIIFSGYNREDGFGSGDLYISFRDKNKTWSKAINLGEEINSQYMDYCPFIDHHSRTLYFTSKRSNFKKVYDFQSIEAVLAEINKNENGQSKIYKVPFARELLLRKSRR